MFLRPFSLGSLSDLTGGPCATSRRDQDSIRTNTPPATKRFKIMVLMPLAVQRGGGELMFLDLIEHGRELNVDWFVVFTSDGPMVQTVRNWGVEAVVVPAGRIRQPHRVVSTIVKLRQLITEKHVDAIISWIAKTHIYGGLAAKFADIPSVWYQLGLPNPPSMQERVATAVPANGILTCSESAMRAQQKVWPHRAVRAVNPGVRLDRFDPDTLPSPLECRRQLGLPTRGALLGIVGRLQRWKGMHYLIEAMPTILRSHPDAH
jgi:glycosyltransferase involved in cell wall biosynthesis